MKTVHHPRPAPTNCRYEPPYPDHDTVVTSLGDPDWVIHTATGRCPLEHPHLMAGCGEFE